MTGLLPSPNWDNPGGMVYRCTKTPYSKKEAQTALNARLRSRHGRPERLRIYLCPKCGCHHLTSKKDYSDDSTE